MLMLIVVVCLLVLTVACVVVGDRVHLPYPILMLLAAMIIAFIPGFPPVHIDPDVILPLFLPPLLFATAQNTSWAVFRARWKELLMLALLLTAITAFATAGILWALMPGMVFPAALVLGAMVAPPDPVAVEAVAEPAHLPRRLLTILSTEGLFNDAVAIVLFQAALVATISHQNLSSVILINFVLAAGAAIAIGFVIGWLYRIASRVITSLEAGVAISVVAPFAAYILSEQIHASGVIAVVVTALETNRNRIAADGETRLTRMIFWKIANLMVTGVAFGLMGLEIRGLFAAEGWGMLYYAGPALLTCGIVIAIRFIAMLILTFLLSPSSQGKRIREASLLTWCGMRGVATLALALSLPETTASGAPFPMRSAVITIAAAVLLVTLVPAGLTLPSAAKLLKIRQDPDEIRAEFATIVERMQLASWEAVRLAYPGAKLTTELREIMRSRFIMIRYELGLPISEEPQHASNMGFPTSVPEVIDVYDPETSPDPEAATASEAIAEVNTRHHNHQHPSQQALNPIMNMLMILGEASRSEVLIAREEGAVDPVVADVVLRKLDLRMMATPKRGK
ncbi:MAG: sodium:proton antiporter [Arcanobacterium sp.]|nr:sodium:proton antiporter [Arcanobacterium sp.]